ncbi:porphobilinogen deaminase [Solidesulfovibrio carbinoliphilus subsp. oakridgensis]|uniref:Porphobilinogen deaminase n=1 Tax=Solidesulfovibrio carbinoliphilus subsp. oakridgensis TaxID=694327 RepID=G7Q7T9_9BACT|nr:hydroxymethylbilane synthase [Solidesulfovibrio carbinoliphilus]EHJ47398.1 porphobilinogen deaminase [Solidesulfovibrio carbinoliphilus subsp. oakridgensis]
MREKLVIATRSSKLALWQANHVSARLRETYPGLVVDLLPIKTKGDKILDVPLAKVGGKGLFVKEIEEALLDGRADLAVHSMKDVPAEQPQGLVVGIVPEREDPCDTLLSVAYAGFAALPAGARVGTSSLRRKAQLMALRPDLSIIDLRGNLDTRVGKLLDGLFDAIVVATAGLNRLGLTAPQAVRLGPPEFLPAAAQGALGLEYRTDDPETAAMLAFFDHPESRDAVAAERGFLARLEGGCQVPIAAHATIDGDALALDGLVADPETGQTFRGNVTGKRSEARALGQGLAESVLAMGAKAVLEAVYKTVS